MYLGCIWGVSEVYLGVSGVYLGCIWGGQEAWRKHGGSMEEAWRRHGGGLKED